MPPPPPRKKPSKSAEESDEWTMPSLSEDPLKARRKLEKMLREIEQLLAQNGVQQQGSTRVLSHEERKKVAHKSSIEDMLRRIMAADTESGCATPTGEGAQPAPDVSMGSGSSHRTRASKQASPLSVASSSSSPAPPNLCQSASGALAAYKSPITDPQERHQPPVTRNAEAAAQAALEERIANLKPHGHVQRVEQRSAEEQREWIAEQQRRRRADAKARSSALERLMTDLRRPKQSLVQLLMGEFALQPCNKGSSGQMRTRFLGQYARSCNTVHAEAATDVASLPQLAEVLRIHKPARELLLEQLDAAKSFGAQWSSGGHRLGKVVVASNQTLMQLRIDIFEEQSRTGRTANNLYGSSDECQQLVESMAASTLSISDTRCTSIATSRAAAVCSPMRTRRRRRSAGPLSSSRTFSRTTCRPSKRALR